MANKTKKNLIRGKDEYSRYYGDFKGVDLASDHTQVHPQRLAYSVNMYKDYRSGQGQALETVPGFRRRIKCGGEIYGIHSAVLGGKERVFVHAGNKLLWWKNYPTGIERKTGIRRFSRRGLSPIESYEPDFPSSGAQIVDGKLFHINGTVQIKNRSTIRRRVGNVEDKYIIKLEFTVNSLGELPAESDHVAEIGLLNSSNTHFYAIKLLKTGKTDTFAIQIGDGYPERECVIGAKYVLDLTMNVGSEEPDVVVRLNGSFIGGESIKYTTSVDSFDGIYITLCYGAKGLQLTYHKLLMDGPRFELLERKVEDVYSVANVEKKDFALFTSSIVQEKAIDYVLNNSDLYVYVPPQTDFTVSYSVLENGAEVEELNSVISDAFTDYTVGMNERKSTSFYANERIYVLDGKNFFSLGIENEQVKAYNLKANVYVPTKTVGTVMGGAYAASGVELEQRNILTEYFKETFIADGESTVFQLSERELVGIEAGSTSIYPDEISVSVYGDRLEMSEEDPGDGKNAIKYFFPEIGQVVLWRSPPKPEEVTVREGQTALPDTKYPSNYAGIEIRARKRLKTIAGVELTDGGASVIKKCTVACLYDNRVFLSGNPELPNVIFYSKMIDGAPDLTYFGIADYVVDGFSSSPVTAMMQVADTLMVLKADTQQEGSVFYHTPTVTESAVQPKIYPSTQGLAGVGCLGACRNFLDDPIFISKYGVEAMGKLSVRYERAIEHRSSLIDPVLTALDLKNASLEEWGGYLVLLVDGKIFLADSRQRYTHDIGVMQYEWYYLEDIGIYSGQSREFHYAAEYPFSALEGVEIDGVPLRLAASVYNYSQNETEDLRGQNVSTSVSQKTFEVNDETFTVFVREHIIRDALSGETVGVEYLLCEQNEYSVGGNFHPATLVKTLGDNLFFGTGNGDVCSFNFDKRGTDGEIPAEWYDFNDRIIYSGCATGMDNCGIPHLTKSTVKKSTVIKTRTFVGSGAKVRVRTNRQPFLQVGRIVGTKQNFDLLDFSALAISEEANNLFLIREKAKKWVEKQYYVYSDEFHRPFAIYNISYRYVIAGRYKE